jgi:hypothetical protein
MKNINFRIVKHRFKNGIKNNWKPISGFFMVVKAIYSCHLVGRGTGIYFNSVPLVIIFSSGRCCVYLPFCVIFFESRFSLLYIILGWPRRSVVPVQRPVNFWPASQRAAKRAKKEPGQRNTFQAQFYA